MNEPLTLAGALLLGLSFGAGPCNVSCLPFLGPVFLARGGGVRTAAGVVLPFSAGRLSGYSLLGLVAGWLGENIAPWVASGALRLVAGGAAVAVGLLLWHRAGRGACGAGAAGERPLLPVRRALPGGLFLMGLGMALNPCAPLGIVLVAAATTASAAAGLTLGAGFGIGAVVVPALLFGYGVAHLGGQLKRQLAHWRRPLERASAALLILLGVATAFGWVSV
ncbi:urease accessory protein UreH domain-containing protein [Endothiovibrio diazotrophicus]